MRGNIITLDTNILVYSIDRDAGERHHKAVDLVDRAVDHECILTLQSLGEFFVAATRKGKMSFEEVSAQIRDWQLLFPIISSQPSSLDKAVSAVQKHHLPFWDALIWAVAQESGVTIFFSEDFQNGRTLGTVRFCNPFLVKDPFG